MANARERHSGLIRRHGGACVLLCLRPKGPAAVEGQAMTWGAGMLKNVAVNSAGLRIGEDHPNARYADAEIDRTLELRDGGMSYGEIARRTHMPKSTVRDICKGRRRGQYASGYKVVCVPD